MNLKKATWAKKVQLSKGLAGLAPKEFDAPVTMAETGGLIMGEALVASPDLGGDLMFVPGGTGFKPHTHHGHHLIFAISGECTVTLGAEIHRLSAGEVCLIPGEVPHAVTGITDTMLLAVGTPHMPVDAADRLELVSFEVLTAELSSQIRCMGCSTHKLYERHEILGADGVVRCPNMKSGGQCRLDAE